MRSQPLLRWMLPIAALGMIFSGAMYYHLNYQTKPTATVVSSSQAVAEQFIRALQANRLDDAMRLTVAPSDREMTDTLALTMVRIGTGYELAKSQTRTYRGSQQVSYIFRVSESKQFRFFRVIVVQVRDEPRVQSSFPNSTEPSAFPANIP